MPLNRQSVDLQLSEEPSGIADGLSESKASASADDLTLAEKEA